jgi:hypothetical protein
MTAIAPVIFLRRQPFAIVDPIFWAVKLVDTALMPSEYQPDPVANR